MTPLHVGLNLVYLEPDSGGAGTYARELIRAMHVVEPGTRITAWVGQGAPDWIADEDVSLVRLPVRSTGSPVHVPVELFGLGLDGRRRGVDVVHGLAYASPVIAPGVATVVTIHDLTWKHQPEAATWLARRMFGLLSPWCGGAADRVIAISETAKTDFVTTLGLDAGKIEVVPHGVAAGPTAPPAPAAELRARFGIGADAPVVLSVAQMNAHKNLTLLVDALPRLAATDAMLVIPGRHTPYRDELVARAAALGVDDRLITPGFVDDATLEGLYATADAFVLPSLLEGFGLPVLEAMRRGVPVACADASALPEVAGDAAVLFDPRDPAAAAAAIDQLLGDAELRATLVRRGHERAAAATWERTARLTLATYRRAIASRVVAPR